MFVGPSRVGLRWFRRQQIAVGIAFAAASGTTFVLTRRRKSQNNETGESHMERGPSDHEKIESTPLRDGYRMLAEWEPHERTWMLWPTRLDNWRQSAQPAQQAFAAVANAIGRFEAVTLGVPPGYEGDARAVLDPLAVSVVTIDQSDAWIRDTGPIFVVKEGTDGGNREIRGVDWGFNAWGGLNGGCYSSWGKDELIARKVLSMSGVGRYAPDFILEGGSVHVDGEGTLITTEECLLNPNRNPGLSKADIEGVLREYLGVRKVLWLGEGIVGDSDTDGHVDNLCAFVRPGEVVLHWTDDRSDPQHAVSVNALKKLESFSDAKGRRIQVHKLRMPGPLFYSDDDLPSVVLEGGVERRVGTRLAASYVNFYLANGGVVIPRFGVPEDVYALKSFKAIFPEREVVQVDTREILLGGGNIHCITQQQPCRGKAPTGST